MIEQMFTDEVSVHDFLHGAAEFPRGANKFCVAKLRFLTLSDQLPQNFR